MGIRREEQLEERDLDDPKYLQDFGREDNCWTAYDLSHLLLIGITGQTLICCGLDEFMKIHSQLRTGLALPHWQSKVEFICCIHIQY